MIGTCEKYIACVKRMANSSREGIGAINSERTELHRQLCEEYRLRRDYTTKATDDLDLSEDTHEAAVKLNAELLNLWVHKWLPRDLAATFYHAYWDLAASHERDEEDEWYEPNEKLKYRISKFLQYCREVPANGDAYNVVQVMREQRAFLSDLVGIAPGILAKRPAAHVRQLLESTYIVYDRLYDWLLWAVNLDKANYLYSFKWNIHTSDEAIQRDLMSLQAEELAHPSVVIA